MDDMTIANLHTATKAIYDRGERALKQARELAHDEDAKATAILLCEEARSVHREVIGLKVDVQHHENAYPTKAIFNFRLWRVMDAVAFALSAEAACTRVLGDATMADLLEKQAADALAAAVEYHDRARAAERELGKGKR
ncbi:MAG: hypothetical protein SFV17_06070 [Candidatus Obscuribacter sp.]|nr:hypothetical protein [Candidatus Obscuribacter sp.]